MKHISEVLEKVKPYYIIEYKEGRKKQVLSVCGSPLKFDSIIEAVEYGQRNLKVPFRALGMWLNT